MKYISTRDAKNTVSATYAIATGLARDGGLFVPSGLPQITARDIDRFRTADYKRRFIETAAGFSDEFSEYELSDFAEKAYGENFASTNPAPVRRIDENTAFLELWHGPTCAFKDMALQMLPLLLTASLKKCGETRKVCVAVATSGDTGKAALEGFRDVDGTSVIVFYPRDGVSEVQKLQMVTQEGENVFVCAVNGNFDDAQRGVKDIFSDPVFAKFLSEKGYMLSSANSINWGRLMPQIAYYISAYCDCMNSGMIGPGEKINFCVPTGNFGNILAGWYAKRMGLPVNRFICASNRNNILTDFINTGIYDVNRPFYTTASPSMDILVSGNLERLLYGLCGDSDEISGYMNDLKQKGVYKVSQEMKETINNEFSGGFCDDFDTKHTIAELWEKNGYLTDTHTAVAYRVLEDYRANTNDSTAAVVLSTASPFKFCEDVSDALGGNTGNGEDPVEALAALTGQKPPAPLRGLSKKKPRFTDHVDKKDMKNAVSGFLFQ